MQRRGGERSQDLGRRQWRRRGQPGAPLCRHRGRAGRQGPCGSAAGRATGCWARGRTSAHLDSPRERPMLLAAARTAKGSAAAPPRPAPRGRGQQPSRGLRGPRPAPPLSPARTRGSGAGQGGWAAPPPQGHGCAPVLLRDPLHGQRHHCLRAAALTCPVRRGRFCSQRPRERGGRSSVRLRAAPPLPHLAPGARPGPSLRPQGLG